MVPRIAAFPIPGGPQAGGADGHGRPAGGVGSTGSAGTIGSDRRQMSAIRPNQEVGIYVSALSFSRGWREGTRLSGDIEQSVRRPRLCLKHSWLLFMVDGFSLLKTNLLRCNVNNCVHPRIELLQRVSFFYF